MRTIGWILGGIYLVDGLVALGGGKRAVKWFNDSFGSSLPEGWQHTMKEMENVDNRVITAWGINNTIAGLGMILIASLASGEAHRPDLHRQAESQ